jgi:N4-gp56 family major capsid protein
METTRTQIPSENTSFYSRELLERAVPFFTYTRFADVKDIPANSGTDTIKFRKYGSLTAQTTALVEGVTPTGKQLSVTDVTAQISYYGDYIVLTDKVNIETIDPILTETASVLGEQVGDSLDQIMRDILMAGTTIQYASTASQRTDITAAMKLTRAEVKEAVRTLKRNNARPVTSMINPGTGYNTVSLNKAFIGIVHPDTTNDLDDAQGWVPVEKYANKSDVMENEIGSLAGVRFIESTNAKVWIAGGSSSADVYGTIIFGMHAFAMTRISGQTLVNIVKPLGSAGADDPLNQRATSGWKLTFAGKILQNPWIVRVEHGATA